MSYFKKWYFTAAIAILVVGFFFSQSKSISSQLAGVKKIALIPTDIAIPSRTIQLDHNAHHFFDRDTRYIFRRDGGQDHLYFVENGISQKVIGDMPSMKNPNWSPPGSDFGWFIDVPSSKGTTTYVTYTKLRDTFIEGCVTEAANLYCLHGNKIKKVISHLRVAAIDSLDDYIHNNGYLDKRGNLFVLTDDGTLCVVRDSQIVAKANVRKIGASEPAIPSMFSDNENTYFLIPKLFNERNSMTGLEFVAEYRLDF